MEEDNDLENDEDEDVTKPCLHPGIFHNLGVLYNTDESSVALMVGFIIFSGFSLS